MVDAAYYATAAAAGIVGGWAFALIWARLAPVSVQKQFWSTLSSVSRSMLVAEQSREFLDLYRRLGVALGRYLSRNIGGLILASLPLLGLAAALSASVFPHLNDPELMFFGMATVGAIAAMICRKSSRGFG
jgi:hypothetical protein